MNEQRSSPRPSTAFPPRGEAARELHGAPLRLILALALLVGCAGDPGVCDAVEGEFCEQCSDGAYTCTYDGVSVTTDACDGCQTRLALYAELCALGRTDRRAEVDAAMVCEPVDTGAE